MQMSGTIEFFSIQHFLMLFVILVLMILGFLYVRKNKSNSRKIHIFLVVLSIILLIMWIACRVSHVYHSIDEGIIEDFFGEERTYNWFMLLPNSFCSLIGLVVPFIIFFKKYKNNKFLESVYSMAIIGLLTNTIYPEYMFRMPFFQFRTCGSIIYHVLMGFIVLVLLYLKELNPQLKNWYYTPISLSLMITLGVFELIYLNLPEAFNISKPLVPGVGVTTVGFLCIGYIVIDIVCRLIIHNKVR